MPSAQRRFPPPWSVEESVRQHQRQSDFSFCVECVFSQSFIRARARNSASCSENLVCWHLDGLGVNNDEPLPPLNSRADCVSYSPVLHQIELCAKIGIPARPGRRSVAKLLTRDEAPRNSDHRALLQRGGRGRFYDLFVLTGKLATYWRRSPTLLPSSQAPASPPAGSSWLRHSATSFIETHFTHF